MNKKREETTIKERKIILKLVCQGKTYREVGECVGRSFSTIRNIINKWKNEGTLINKTGRGRKKILSPANEKFISRIIQKDPGKSINNLTAEVSTMIGKPLSKETVRRTLRMSGFNGRIARRKPFISEVNRKKRLEFARTYINHPPEFWENVIFTDESKFNIFGSDGKKIVWRKANTELNKENLCATVKHGGGNVMVWGCMAAAGVGNIVFIESTMDKMQFLDILKNNLKPSAIKLGLSDKFWYQQDNDPKHTAGIVKLWLLYNTPKQLKTPPQSPDINPIEHLWSVLERKIRQFPITNKERLKSVISTEWEKISADVTKKLVDSMPRRLEAIIKAKGYPTKY